MTYDENKDAEEEENSIAILISERDQLLAKVTGMEALVRQVRDCPSGTVIDQSLKDKARELMPI